MKKMKFLGFFTLVFCSSLVWTGCGSDDDDDINTTPDPTPEVSFKSTVKPIIDTSCAISGCHVAGTGRVDFTVLANIQAQASTMKVKLNNGSMPKTGTITSTQKTNIVNWIDQGAKDN